MQYPGKRQAAWCLDMPMHVSLLLQTDCRCIMALPTCHSLLAQSEYPADCDASAADSTWVAMHHYILCSRHALQSEYPPDCDARRAFISGFDGSAGTAVVTTDAALLWTDGRYFLQARARLAFCWRGLI